MKKYKDKYILIQGDLRRLPNRRIIPDEFDKFAYKGLKEFLVYRLVLERVQRKDKKK